MIRVIASQSTPLYMITGWAKKVSVVIFAITVYCHVNGVDIIWKKMKFRQNNALSSQLNRRRNK